MVNTLCENLEWATPADTYCGYPARASAEMGDLIICHVTGVAKEALLEFIEKGSAMEIHSPLWKMKGIFLSRPLNYVADNLFKIND